MEALRTGAPRIARPALSRMVVDALAAGHVLLVAGAGYGKTMALEEGLERTERPAVWVTCADAGGEAARLLADVVAGLRAAVPGIADVMGDTLAAALEPVDVRSATRTLRAELERLLVEPVVIVFDDAEQLADAPEALAVVEQLLNARGVPLSVAIATRRSLALRLAKLRASGRLAELGPPELSLNAGECEELLRLRHHDPVGPGEVEAVLAASEGWPMGVALSGLAGSGEATHGPVSQDELFHYLAEEVLDRLDPRTRLHLLDASVPDALTPELGDALGLPPGFLDEAERSALFLRMSASGDRSFHPLFRDFLRERLLDLRTDDERAQLHRRVADHLVASGRRAEAIGHWLEAGRHERALQALVEDGGNLARTAPATVWGWMKAIAPDLHRDPSYRLVEGQLLWAAGDHEHAVEPLRAAVSGYAAAGNEEGAWLARLPLADTLLLAGGYDEIPGLAERWEDATGTNAFVARAVAWWAVVAFAVVGRLDDAAALTERLSDDPEAASPFAFLDGLIQGGVAQNAGHSRAALEMYHATIAELEVDDPFARLPYVLGTVLVIHRIRGDHDAALEWIGRCERESERLGMSWPIRDFRLQRATLLAQRGDLAAAEVEVARAGRRTGAAGWIGVYEREAEAHVALSRGDGTAAEAARRAIATASLAPVSWHALATVEMAGILAESGAIVEGREAIDATLALLDERFPGEVGDGHRCVLLAARACLEHRTGDANTAVRTLAAAWDAAGEEAPWMVRKQWPAVRPVLWQALADGVLAHEAVVPAMRDALPGGEALVAMVEHPDPPVRRAALEAALLADHLEVLARLDALTGDDDEQVAATAAATRERLRDRPPPLRYELLGRFAVRRAGWEVDESSWKRPMAARVVRFLLVQGGAAVPEDSLFEAFWADRPADNARQHLAVAVSRARKVLDLPGATQSVIDVRERTYRLVLRQRDSIDAVDFEAAATAALAEPGPGTTASLERAAARWTGEPLPADRYAEWSAGWRDRLVETYTQVLTALATRRAAAGDQHGAIRAARALLEVDPANERAHRQLMVAYARGGRTSHALRQYLECRRALVVELGVEPSAETSRLHARILAGEPVLA